MQGYWIGLHFWNKTRGTARVDLMRPRSAGRVNFVFLQFMHSTDDRDILADLWSACAGSHSSSRDPACSMQGPLRAGM